MPTLLQDDPKLTRGPRHDFGGNQPNSFGQDHLQDPLLAPTKRAPKPPQKLDQDLDQLTDDQVEEQSLSLKAPTIKAPKPHTGMQGQSKRQGKKPLWNGGGKQGLVVGGLMGLRTGLGLRKGMDSPQLQGDVSGGGGGLLLNGVLLGESIEHTISGGTKIKEGKFFQDQGMVRMGKEDQVQGGKGIVKNMVGLGKNTGTVLKGLGMVGGGATMLGFSVLGNAIKAGESAVSLVRIGRTLRKSWKTKLLTGHGTRWRRRVVNRKKRAALLNGLKFAAAAAGIIGGTMLLVSNPVGWVVGLTAFATLVGLGLSGMGLGKKVTDHWRTNKKIKELKKQEDTDKGSESDTGKQGKEEVDTKGDFKHDGKTPMTKSQRKKIKELGDKAARELRKNARYAHEMRVALRDGEAPYKDALVDQYDPKLGFRKKIKWNRMPLAAKKFSDASTITDTLLGVSVEEAMSSSGQQLIERKLSALG